MKSMKLTWNSELSTNGNYSVAFLSMDKTSVGDWGIM